MEFKEWIKANKLLSVIIVAVIVVIIIISLGYMSQAPESKEVTGADEKAITGEVPAKEGTAPETAPEEIPAEVVEEPVEEAPVETTPAEEVPSEEITEPIGQETEST